MKNTELGKEAKQMQDFEIPANLVPLKDWLVKSWDEYDAIKKEKVEANRKARNEYLKEHGHRFTKETMAFFEKYPVTKEDIDYYVYKTQEDWHESNIKDAIRVIKNLIDRIEKKCGSLVSYRNIKLKPDNDGFMILNGYVEGDKGKATVKSVYAGGYNIQRLHIRVLVK